MPCAAASRSVARSTAVSGSHSPAGRRPNRSSKSRMPQAISVRRSAAEASGRIVWWNGWAIALPPLPPRRTARSVVGVLGREPRGERRPEVPRDPGEVAALGVRAVALGVDALRSSRGTAPPTARRDLAGPRVEARRLVEVGVDRQPAAGHRAGRRRRSRGPAASRSPVCSTRDRRRLARPERDDPAGAATRAALVDELEARLGVRDGLDRRDPDVDRRIEPSSRPRCRGSRCRRAIRLVAPAVDGARRGRSARPPTSCHAAGLPPPPRSIVDHSMASRAVERPVAACSSTVDLARSGVGSSRPPPIRIVFSRSDGDRAVADPDDAVPDERSRRRPPARSPSRRRSRSRRRSSTPAADLVGRRVRRRGTGQAGAALVGVVAEVVAEGRPASSSRCRGSRRARSPSAPSAPSPRRRSVAAPPRSIVRAELLVVRLRPPAEHGRQRETRPPGGPSGRSRRPRRA